MTRLVILITLLAGLPHHTVSLVPDFIKMIPKCYTSPAHSHLSPDWQALSLPKLHTIYHSQDFPAQDLPLPLVNRQSRTLCLHHDYHLPGIGAESRFQSCSARSITLSSSRTEQNTKQSSAPILSRVTTTSNQNLQYISHVCMSARNSTHPA